MVNSRGISSAFAVLMLLLITGCSDQLPLYPVTGKVQFTDGGSVHVGTVELRSREHGVHARGTIQPDGTFQLTTYQQHDGAVAGIHDCVVVQFVMAEGVERHRPSRIGVIDRRFASYTSSGLTVEVSPTLANQVVIEVEGIIAKQPDDHTHKN